MIKKNKGGQKMFKILFKPIKWILTIVLSTVILIAIPFVLMYKSVTPPDVDENEINYY